LLAFKDRQGNYAMPRLDSGEYASYYEKYVALVPENEILPVFKSTLVDTLGFLREVSDGDASVLHRPYTWSIKQVVGHLTDSERVFTYRALCFARGDPSRLPGFDENAYAQAAEFDIRALTDLTHEFEAVRRSTIALFGSFSPYVWSRRGIANGDAVSVRALAYIIVGHHRHHSAILRQRLAKG
jgi:hypothetical protein